MITAREIMTREVVSIKKTASISEAIEKMLGNEVAGLPVVDDEMSLIGIISEKDILKLYGTPEEALVKTVEEFMTAPAIYFEQDDSLQEICICLIEQNFRRVPVTVDGKVIGVISRPDVARSILELSRQAASNQ